MGKRIAEREKSFMHMTFSCVAQERKKHGLNFLQGKGIFSDHFKGQENDLPLSFKAGRNGTEGPKCLETWCPLRSWRRAVLVLFTQEMLGFLRHLQESLSAIPLEIFGRL